MAKITKETFIAPGLPDRQWSADIRVDSSGEFHATVPPHLAGRVRSKEWSAETKTALLTMMHAVNKAYNEEQRSERSVLKFSFATDPGNRFNGPKKDGTGTLQLAICWGTETRVVGEGGVEKFTYASRHTELHEEYPWPLRFAGGISTGVYFTQQWYTARPADILDDTPELRAFMWKVDAFWEQLATLLTTVFDSAESVQRALVASMPLQLSPPTS